MGFMGKVQISEVKRQDNGYAISFGPNLFFLQDGQNEGGAAPKVGDFIEVKVHNGSFVSGVRINGEIIFDLNDEEIEAEAVVVGLAVDRQRRELFEKQKDQIDKDYAALPPQLQARIDRFRGNNPDFRWKYEIYEMAISRAAVAIAKKYPTENDLVVFKKTPYEQQLAAVPELFDFSNHMVGFSILLAGLYVVAPDEVVKLPGALAPTLGEKEYG